MLYLGLTRGSYPQICPGHRCFLLPVAGIGPRFCINASDIKIGGNAELAMPLTPEEKRLYDLARDRVQRGDLPSTVPRSVWGGQGSAQPCALCGKYVSPTAVEDEISGEGGQNYHFHLRCFAIWQLAAEPPRAAPSSTVPA